LKSNAFPGLLSLLGDQDSQVIQWATYPLFQIVRSLEGAQATLDSGALEHILALLESPSRKVQKRACIVVGMLAVHESAAPALLELKPCARLVTLLLDQDSGAVAEAAHALSQIARWLDGARAVVCAKAFRYVHILALLESPNSDIQQGTCRLLGRLATHHSTAPAIMDLNLSVRLGLLLREPATRPAAIFALRAISGWLDGVAALADTDVSERLEELTSGASLDIDDHERARTVLDNLARYKAGRPVESIVKSWGS